MKKIEFASARYGVTYRNSGLIGYVGDIEDMSDVETAKQILSDIATDMEEVASKIKSLDWEALEEVFFEDEVAAPNAMGYAMRLLKVILSDENAKKWWGI